MSVRDKYIKIFGEIKSLEESISWCTTISNVIEWLTWEKSAILGISKTQIWKLAVKYSHEASENTSELAEKQKYVEKKLAEVIKSSEATERYDLPKSSLATPREMLRRVKYFSEVYLNQEFDIFFSLVSNSYLTQYYQQFTNIESHAQWFTHSNSGLFQHSVNIAEMQMDNLSYNSEEPILIANELKLGGHKNPDQILKYSLMYKLLVERGFISKSSRFLLLLLSDGAGDYNWEDLLKKEIEYCEKSSKSTARRILDPDVINIARAAEYAGTTWHELLAFNEKYMSNLDPSLQQVEYKLLWGFNESLRAKAFMQSS